MRREVAAIVGGAETAFEEFERLRKMCNAVDLRVTTFVVNDIITVFSGKIDHMVTLHRGKLEGWLHQRAVRGYPRIGLIWSPKLHRNLAIVDRTTDHWGGSVGLFATKVALVDLNIRPVVLCGVHMTEEGGHLVRRKRWMGAEGFRKHWVTNKKILTGSVRSFGGWTAELLGVPTEEWIREVSRSHDRQAALVQ